jgi:hypothetical protein
MFPVDVVATVSGRPLVWMQKETFFMIVADVSSCQSAARSGRSSWFMAPGRDEAWLGRPL